MPLPRCPTVTSILLSIPKQFGFGLLVTLAIIASVILIRCNMLNRVEPRRIIPARVASKGNNVSALEALCREAPIQIAPATNLRHLVTDEEVNTVLCNAVPIWNPPTVPSLIHELKLWGRHAPFTGEMLGLLDERPPSFVVSTLLDDKECRENTTSEGGSYLIDSPYGIRVVLYGTSDAQGGDRAEGHLGQLLKALGEAGVPSTTPVTTSSGHVGTVAEVFQDAVLRFSFSQEPEFIGCALAMWLPPQKSWLDQFGTEHTFDELLELLIHMPLGEGACGGCHVPFTVVTLLRVDEEHSILSHSSRLQAREWLTGISAILEARQCEDGGWDRTWSGANDAIALYDDHNLDVITMTGHHLEWIGLAPNDCRPGDSTIRRAVISLVHCTSAMLGDRRSFKTQFPASHAARALCWMRGVDPYATFIEAWEARTIRRIRYAPQPFHLERGVDPFKRDYR